MDKIILFELNEVPIKIIDYYRKMRPQSWMAQNMDRMKKFETYCENGGHISPWNTWPTLHRGVTNQAHFISDFNQDLSEVDKAYPAVWNILAQNKIKTGVFGSLHSYPPPESQGNFSFYVPDVFATGSECFPKNVELFQDINLRLSRKSARNVDSTIPYKDMFRLFGKIGSLGFKASTMKDVASHLVQERTTRWKTVRRRTYQTVLSFDVFYKLLKKEKPDFTTFFTNHVASSQHRYWAAVFPNEYEDLKYDQEWISTYENEILFTMGKADDMLRKLAQFVDKNPEYKLMVTSSMGQEAVESEPIETQLYVTNHDAFFQQFGIAPNEYEFLPSMLPQFNYFVKDAEGFKKQLDTFKVNDKQVHYRDLGEGRFSIDLGQQNLKTTGVEINGEAVSLEDSGLENVVIKDKSSATAYHIPEGHCYVYHPSFQPSKVNEQQVSTREIMPTILENFGVPVPDYAEKPRLTILS
jgi:predicted AlkP superfamily phosphohydrolase/phosphomutase